MSFSRCDNLGFTKKLEEGTTVYEIDEGTSYDISTEGMELSTIENILNDFENSDCGKIAFKGSDKAIKKIKYGIPFFRDKLNKEESNFEGNFKKGYRLRMGTAFGIYSLISYGLGYHLSESFNMDNPLLGSAILGTSSVASMLTCFALEKKGVKRKRKKLERRMLNLERLETEINSSSIYVQEREVSGYA